MDNDLYHNSNDAEFHYRQGLIHFSQGNFKRAIREYKRALQINPNLWEVYLHRSNAYLQIGKTQEAIGDLNRQPLLFTENAYFYFIWGCIHFNLEDYQEAIEAFNKSISIDSSDANAYWGRGIIYQVWGEYLTAIDDFKQALNLNPSLDLKSELAEAYLDQGMNFWCQGNKNQALEYLTQAIHLNPDYSLAYCYRGAILSSIGDIEAAVENYLQAIHISPQCAEYYLMLGNIYSYKIKNKITAIKIYDMALEIDPDFAEAYFLRGNARYFAGNVEGSVKDYDQVSRIYPMVSSPKSVLVSDAFKSEIREFIYKIYPAFEMLWSPSLLLIRGHIRGGLGDYQGMINDFTQLHNLISNSTETFALIFDPTVGFAPDLAYLSLGSAYLALGDYETAIANCIEVLKINFNFAYAYKIRGIALNQQGNTQEAIWDFQRAEKIFHAQGDTLHSQEMLNLIRKLEPPTELLDLRSEIQRMQTFMQRQIEGFEKKIESLLEINPSIISRLEELDSLKQELYNSQIILQSHSRQLIQLQQEFSGIMQLVANIKANIYEPSTLLSQLQTLHSQVENAIRSIPNQVNETVEVQIAEINQLLKTIQPYEYELIINRKGSRSEILNAVQLAKKRLIIVCPWPHYGIHLNNKELICYFKAFIENRMGRIDIGWGHYQDIKSVQDKPGSLRQKLKTYSNLYSGLNDLEKLEAAYPGRFELKLLGTHEKFFVCDHKFAMLGSHNFLTSGDKSPEREIGIRTTDPRIIEGLINLFQNGRNIETYKF
jgi:tetratricopeptide (TPR) repeat protein